MKEIVPDYYKDFKCIADKCKNSCCVGWEIDIDDDTYSLYENTVGNFGEKLLENISDNGYPHHFILTQNERCPFLNENNLCEIIKEKGEGYLCQICSDHPRFKNFYSDVTETGLGLCCEEACRIILFKKDTFKLIYPDNINELLNVEEREFFNNRQEIFDIIQNRKVSFIKRIKNVMESFDIPMVNKALSYWADIFLKLERFCDKWDEKIKVLYEAEASDGAVFTEENAVVFEQLFCYFVFRHLSDSLYEDDFNERLCFCILSTFIIGVICCFEDEASDGCIAEIARMYSAEIEYSDENTQTLLDEIYSVIY